MFNVKGMSIQDLLNIAPNDLASMNVKDLKAINTRLISAANKRIKRFKAAGANAPTSRAYSKSLTGFSKSTHFTLDQSGKAGRLQNQYSQLSRFIGYKTSYLRGARKTENDIFKGLVERTEKRKVTSLKKERSRFSKRQLKNFWKAYNRSLDVIPSTSKEDSNSRQKILTDIMKKDKNLDLDGLTEELNKQYEKYYEDKQYDENVENGEGNYVSAFKEI